MSISNIFRKIGTIQKLAAGPRSAAKLYQLFVLRYNYPGFNLIKRFLPIKKKAETFVGIKLNGRTLTVHLRPNDIGDVAGFFENFFEIDYEELEISQATLLYDCGANVGFFSLAVAAFNPSCKIFLFEPNPSNLPLLEKNCTSNKLHAEILKKAVWTEVGDLHFQTEQSNAGHISTESTPNTLTVQSISLKDFIVEKLVSDCPDYIKMDIEGAEEAVLPQIWSIPFPHTIRLYVEIHSSCKILPPLKEGWIKEKWQGKLISSYSDNDGWFLKKTV